MISIVVQLSRTVVILNLTSNNSSLVSKRIFFKGFIWPEDKLRALTSSVCMCYEDVHCKYLLFLLTVMLKKLNIW